MTGPGSSPSNVPDLAALREDLSRLREAADHARAYPWDVESWASIADYLRVLDPTVVSETAIAVLSLVEEQQKEIERLREAMPYSDHLRTCAIAEKRPPGVCTCGYSAVLDALAGSPAANKEPS